VVDTGLEVDLGSLVVVLMVDLFGPDVGLFVARSGVLVEGLFIVQFFLDHWMTIAASS